MIEYILIVAGESSPATTPSDMTSVCAQFRKFFSGKSLVAASYKKQDGRKELLPLDLLDGFPTDNSYDLNLELSTNVFVVLPLRFADLMPQALDMLKPEARRHRSFEYVWTQPYKWVDSDQFILPKEGDEKGDDDGDNEASIIGILTPTESVASMAMANVSV